MIKLQKYKDNKITLTQLKEILIRYYYQNAPIDIKSEMERELIVTEIKDCYGTNSTTIFSINGSPPKGIGVLLRCSYTKDLKGNLILLENSKTSKPYSVHIIKQDSNLDLVESQSKKDMLQEDFL